MKRYHTLLAGASWMAEYGNPDTDDWEFLQKYSPYHSTSKLVRACLAVCRDLPLTSSYARPAFRY
jgi:hypothetical protein